MNMDGDRSSFFRGIVKGIFLAVTVWLRLRTACARGLPLVMLLTLPAAVQAQDFL